MKYRLPVVLAVIAIIAALLLPLHQKIAHGFWFNLHSAWHHESIEACLVALALGLLVGSYFCNRHN